MPSPVHSGRKPIVKGTAMPATPGFSQGSPSRVMPWTAIATIPASAVCSWIASSLRESPGRRITLPAIARPRPTEIVTRTSATRPEARLASHQPWVCRVVEAAGVHAAPSAAEGLGNADAGPGRERADRLDPAVVVDEQPAALGEDRTAALGAGEQRRLGEGLGLDRGVAEGGGADQPGPGRLAGGGVEQVVGVAAVVAAPDPHVEARGGDGAGAEPSTKARSPVSGCSTKTS